jgi:hypothetical protein
MVVLLFIDGDVRSLLGFDYYLINLCEANNGRCKNETMTPQG